MSSAPPTSPWVDLSRREHRSGVTRTSVSAGAPHRLLV
ncbi:hypothetical protein Ae168Ps1_4732 [Pseudonocardia sp. Ae168_Ps1]|nr:hypothetical protein Ae150APs1_4705 [Pseudonocardia sp. Ae150A_Ps1]OLL82326.1 hypothetical protein Ae168Ps1_4732 [Pseudonocardia sp. Ae168_Ps1]OLL83558.1 hypothetical protein Ae263Ps1_0613c [Pseudonocardia sp. Ae263_Ps1]OLL90402.1 hypothetical protein Ae356Ps1_0299 [Pseudonocardia sp. Ae356_Ps1]